MDYHTAVYLVIGAAIGSVTPNILASFTTNRDGKRTAVLNLVFNIFRAILLSTLIGIFPQILNWIQALSPNSIARQIANTHTIFAIIAVLVMLPFTNMIIKIAKKIIPYTKEENERAEDRKLVYMVNTTQVPAEIAIKQAYMELGRLADMAISNLELSVEAFFDHDSKKYDKVEEKEATVDFLTDAISEKLVDMRAMDLSEHDTFRVSKLTLIASNYERISDHAVNIVEKAQEMDSKGLAFSDEAEDELSVYSKAVADIVDMAFQVLEEHDFDLAYKVEPLEETIDRLTDELKERHYNRLRRGTCSIDMGFLLSDITTNYERVADHCSNIAVDLIQIKDNAFEVHEYLDELKRREDAQFQEEYRKNRQKYALPPIGKDEKAAFADAGEGIGAGTGAGTGKEANAARA